MDGIKALQKLGLTEYEARAYFSLARIGPSTVREIVFDSKLPRNKAYEALQRLEEKNKVAYLPVSPRKYKIISPESFKEDISQLNDSVNSLIKLMSQPKATEFKDLFWVIKSKKAIEEKLALQNTKARKEILSCNTLSKILYGNIRTMKQTVDRGVKVKMISTFDKNRIPSYNAWLKTGAEIRVFNHDKFGPLLPRITIFDGEIARLTLGEPEVKKEGDYITLWTESRAFSNMLRNHFLEMWKKSKPIEKFI
ncbi:MAG: helix-turn-helix domain-containing protein [Nanoarchaeota archaeon]|nr:helix-turn-helix domain-containing protein [Nanoarchaeota archaeon]